MRQILLRHQKKYPLSTIEDYIKLIYQSVFAGGHMIKSKDSALKYLLEECKEITNFPNKDTLYEYISNDYIRIYLKPYLQYFNDVSYINNAFCQTSNSNTGSIQVLKYYLLLLKEMITKKEINLNIFDSYNFLNEYEKNNYPIYHHSNIYKENYYPNYRIIDKKYLTNDMKKKQIELFLEPFKNENLTVIAIEGKCCSLKSTITSLLENVTVIRADDFFLNEDLKQVQTEIGDYIDYKLLENEVLNKLTPNTYLTYKVYNCEKGTYELKTSYIHNIVIVEGVYSYNQYIKKYYNKLIYFHVDEKDQMDRLKSRCKSKALLNRFINEWIPKENDYYELFDIFTSSDLII